MKWKHKAVPIRNKSGFVSGDQFADLTVNQFTKYIISQSTISQSTVLQSTVLQSTISQTTIFFCYTKNREPINSTTLQAHFFKKSPFGNL